MHLASCRWYSRFRPSTGGSNSDQVTSYTIICWNLAISLSFTLMCRNKIKPDDCELLTHSRAPPSLAATPMEPRCPSRPRGGMGGSSFTSRVTTLLTHVQTHAPFSSSPYDHSRGSETSAFRIQVCGPMGGYVPGDHQTMYPAGTGNNCLTR